MAYIGENPNFKSTILDDKAATVVPNAPTGKTRIINRDGSLFLQDDTGTEKEVGTGGGGTNYVLNPNAEINVTDNTTGVNITVTSESGVTLEGDNSFLLRSANASNGTFDWSIDISDAYVTDAGILLGVSALFNTGASVDDGHYTVGIFNTNDTVYATHQLDIKAGFINTYSYVDHFIDSLNPVQSS